MILGIIFLLLALLLLLLVVSPFHEKIRGGGRQASHLGAASSQTVAGGGLVGGASGNSSDLWSALSAAAGLGGVKGCRCAATSGNKDSCCSNGRGAGKETGTFCGSLFTHKACSGDTPICCTSFGASACCKEGSTCSAGCGGRGVGGAGFGRCGCVDPPPLTTACPNPVSTAYGTACMCTGASCGTIPEPDPDRLREGHAFVVTSRGLPGSVSFLEPEYVPLSKVASAQQPSGTTMNLEVDPRVKHQTIIGFGGAFTDAVAYNYELADPAIREELVRQYFGKGGIGYSTGRVHIGGVDFSRMDYSLDNVSGDFDLEHFCLRDDRDTNAPCGSDYKADVIQAAQRSLAGVGAAKLKLFASTWSAPTWFKDQNFSCELVDGMSKCTPGASRTDAVLCTQTVSNPATCVQNAQGVRCPKTPIAWTQQELSLSPGAFAESEVMMQQRRLASVTDKLQRQFEKTFVSKTPISNADSNCYNSGYLKNEHRIKRAWARYMVKFIDAYKAMGIDMWGLTVQNEPLATTCLWASMFYTPELQADFVANYLGPALREAHPEVKLMIHDDQTVSLLDFAGEILKNEAAARYVDGVAYHWYMTMEGTFENGPARTPLPVGVNNLVGGGVYVHEIFERLQAQGEDKFVLMSEACNGYLLGTEWIGPRPGDWGYGYAYSHDILWQLRNGAAGWTDWNLWLDARGGPNLAGNFVDSPVLMQGAHAFYQNPSFFHMAHFSKYVLPGSRRVGLSIDCNARDPAYCQAVAFLTPNRTVVVVMTNDEVTVGPLGAGETNVCISSICVPRLGEFVIPPLAKGQGSFTTSRSTTMSWTIRCGGRFVSGELPWKAIQTVVMPCSDAS